MSMRAVLLGVRDHLRATSPAGLGFLPLECEVTMDGQPVPMSGERFVGVHPAEWSTPGSGSEMESLDENYGVQITVSMRLPKVPEDVWGPKLLCLKTSDNTTGLYDLCEQIRAKVHMNYTCMKLMNGYIAGVSGLSPTVNGFVQPFAFRNAGQPQKRGGQWYWANTKEQNAGVSVTLNFGDARRVQVIESQT